MFLGGSVESFALPFAAFIVVSCMLFLVFRHPHSLSQLKYSARKQQTSVRTAEPGQLPARQARSAETEQAEKSADMKPGTATGTTVPKGKE